MRLMKGIFVFYNITASFTSISVNKEKTKAVFHIPQAMTKWEVKQYLTGIYKLNVTKVDTANFLGKTLLFTSPLNIKRAMEKIVRKGDASVI